MMGKFENTDFVVAVGLIVALWAALFIGMTELANYIVAGLVGYMGRAAVSRQKEGEHDGK